MHRPCRTLNASILSVPVKSFKTGFRSLFGRDSNTGLELGSFYMHASRSTLDPYLIALAAWKASGRRPTQCSERVQLH